MGPRRARRHARRVRRLLGFRRRGLGARDRTEPGGRRCLPRPDRAARTTLRQDNRYTPAVFGRYLAEHIPDATFVELGGGGHLYWVGEPRSHLERDRAVRHWQARATQRGARARHGSPSRPSRRGTTVELHARRQQTSWFREQQWSCCDVTPNETTRPGSRPLSLVATHRVPGPSLNQHRRIVTRMCRARDSAASVRSHMGSLIKKRRKRMRKKKHKKLLKKTRWQRRQQGR